MTPEGLDFYRAAAAMTELPDDPAVAGVPDDLDAMRSTVQGLLLHRDWATAYGVPKDAIRIDEQNLRSTKEVLGRALEISDEPVTTARPPVDRVLCICRHFTLLHTAFLRDARCAGPRPVRVLQLLRPVEVVRPLDHRALGRRTVGARRPADRRAPGEDGEPRLRSRTTSRRASSSPGARRGSRHERATSTRASSASSTCGASSSSRAT